MEAAALVEGKSEAIANVPVAGKLPAKEDESAVVPAGSEETGNSSSSGSSTSSPRVKNRIQVSTNKKPLYFYVNLAKKLMEQHNEVVLSALGMAISTVVVISEILKNNGFATQKHILTSTVDSKDEGKGRVVLKPRIEILLGKTENFNDLITASKSARIVKAAEA